MNLPPQVTDRAYSRLAEIAEMTGEGKALRVGVLGGGCSGFSYDIRLDEPAAGCNAVETEEIDHLIAEVAASGVAILLVEHDMKMVMRISNHIVVLDHLAICGDPIENDHISPSDVVQAV